MALSRREFLAGSGRALLAGSAGFGLLSSVGCEAPTFAPPVGPGKWAQLAQRLTGVVVRSGDPGFARLALPNNLRYASIQPAGIALCESAQDVSASVLWAREFNVPLVARSGGHSYGGYSTTTGLMIDVRRMRSLKYDAATGIATLGGGARNADVYRELRPVGRAVTHGRCYRVGIAGLTLGGGVGFNMRANGLTCDQLVGSEIVTADGKIRRLSATENSDLYWASRGAGGGNFGINTSFRFATFAVDRLTVYNLHWVQRPDAVFAALLQALEAAPVALGCKVSVVPPTKAQRAEGRDLSITLLGQLRGTRAELMDILQPVYRIERPSGEILEDSYWNGQDFLSEPGPPEYFHEPSRFFEGPFTDEAIAVVLDGMRAWPGTATAASFKLFETGGAVNQVPSAATAFVHRESSWLTSIGLVWEAHDSMETVQRNLEWQSAFYARYTPFARGGAYQNFIDPSLKEWKQAYYGKNLGRLEEIKTRVDPSHVFAFAEAIP